MIRQAAETHGLKRSPIKIAIPTTAALLKFPKNPVLYFSMDPI